MAASIAEDVNNPHINTSVFIASNSKNWLILSGSQLLVQILENLFLMVLGMNGVSAVG